MSNEFNHIEAFEAYYNNELSANAKIGFEERLDSDLEFKHEYSLYLQLQEAINTVGDDQLKVTLDDYHTDYINSKTRGNTTLKIKIYLSGFFLLLITIGLLLLFFPEETAQQRIEEHTAHIEPTIYTQKIIVEKEVDSLEIATTLVQSATSVQKMTDSSQITENAILKAPLKRYKTPSNPLYELNDSILHFYGFSLKNGGYILLDQNNHYLITPSNSYLLEKSQKKKALKKVKKRLYESIIKNNNQPHRVTKLHKVVFEDAKDSLTIIFDKKLQQKTYSFDGTQLKVSDLISQQLQLISFEKNIYLLNSENLFLINQGVNQELTPATQTEKNNLKSTTVELPILTETVEKTIEWENSN